MASPVDAGRAATSVASASSPWSVNLPATPVAGDLLIVFGRAGTTATFTLPSGWSWLLNNDASDASDDTTAVMYKWADGTEGTSLSLSVTPSLKGGAIAWRITGAANPATQVPEIASATFLTTANTADPPSISPTGGSKDYLFIVLGGVDNESGSFSAAPSGYSNLITANSSVGGAASTNVLMGGATKQATAASEDPGVFTHAVATTGGLANTIAVHPAGVAAAAFVPQIVIT